MWHLAQEVFEQGSPAGPWRALAPLELEADVAIDVSACPYRIEGSSVWLLQFSRGGRPFRVDETVNERAPTHDSAAGDFALKATRTGSSPYACSTAFAEELRHPRPLRFLGTRSAAQDARLWSIKRTYETALHRSYEVFLFDPDAGVVRVERDLFEKDRTE